LPSENDNIKRSKWDSGLVVKRQKPIGSEVATIERIRMRSQDVWSEHRIRCNRIWNS
jgi:hypothetical protein